MRAPSYVEPFGTRFSAGRWRILGSHGIPGDLRAWFHGVEAARDRIAPLIWGTPAHRVSHLTDSPVVLKLENLQRTGSFKVRGAANKLSLLVETGAAHRGVVCCSSGNHGLAVAAVARELKVAATVCVPDWVDNTKLGAIKRHGATAVLAGPTYDDAEDHAKTHAGRTGAVFVDPFDDEAVIQGQGTIGLELLSQMPDVQTVLIPLSGGGLAGGVGAVVRTLRPDVKIVAVGAENASVMVQSIKAGRPLIGVAESPTIANALSGGIGRENLLTFNLVREVVDDFALVSETEIRGAIGWALRHLHLVVEGGGATVLAALRRHAYGPDTAAVVSGGNISRQLMVEILNDPVCGSNAEGGLG